MKVEKSTKCNLKTKLAWKLTQKMRRSLKRKIIIERILLPVMS
jgi:hypothetical protein